jgi:hypothetical protein
MVVFVVGTDPHPDEVLSICNRKGAMRDINRADQKTPIGLKRNDG